MPYKNPPGNVADFNRRIQMMSNKSGISTSKLIGVISYTVVAQMLPDGTAMKGGSSLSLRYPLQNSRNSQDFDLVYKKSLEEFRQEFSNNLKIGWSDFTGTIVDRGKPVQNSNMPAYLKMTPLNIKLNYKGKPFKTVEMDATPQIFDEVESAIVLPELSTVNIFSELLLPEPKTSYAISIENQLAQKLQGLSNPEVPRPRDLVDIQYILQQDGNNIDKDKLNKFILREFDINKFELPMNIARIRELNKEGYELLRNEYDNLLPFEQAITTAEDLVNDAIASKMI